MPPVTAAAEPKFYAFQDSANLGVIQYSRGPSNAVPTPLTSIQSSAAAVTIASNGTSNVFDFTLLNRCFCTLYAGDTTLNRTVVADVLWTGTTIFFITNTSNPSGATALTAQGSGAVLQLKAPSTALNNVYWTLVLHRTS